MKSKVKSKLKSRLRLKIACLMIGFFACGLLLGLTFPRDRRQNIASAATHNITEIPYTSITYSLSQNSFDVFIPSSGFYNTPLVLTFTTSNSNISFYLADSSSTNSGSALTSGQTIQFNSSTPRLRVNSGLFGGGDFSFSLSYSVQILDTPVLSISDDMLYWTSITNASYYSVFQNGTLIATLSDSVFSYHVTTSGVYTVRAIGNDTYQSSDWSNEVTYTAPTSVTLPTPTLNISGSILSWNAIENATAYSVFRDGTLIANVSDTNLTYNVTSSGVYTIRALGDGDYYLNSDWSNEVTYNAPTTIPLNPPTISLSGNILSWNAVSNATEYSILLDGRLLTTITETSYTVNTAGVYTVRALGDNTNYSPSEISNSVTYTGSPATDETVFSPFRAILQSCSDFLGIGLFGDNRVTLGFLFSIGLGIMLLGAIIRLFFHG